METGRRMYPRAAGRIPPIIIRSDEALDRAPSRGRGQGCGIQRPLKCTEPRLTSNRSGGSTGRKKETVEQRERPLACWIKQARNDRLVPERAALT
ncbi:hypothetical protein KNP414_03416 [Paenibacillus mucilaginosus KNP414]|uniref:Uncharacterized protein n=1 Tax=Paenibacillus mucilaginosus (strain KNP414) TaxID=1036673 RepID=F8F8R2_PAEMK|nr:hypothetical protein KNP414_03416 [Paenibacillus mucilaginosus KNP414]